jgi:hypothetical protein
VELKSLTYTSWASPGIVSADVDSILRSARVNNPLQGLTGILIFNGSAFLQILEGVAPAIDELVATLRSDRRHSNMSIRDERPIGARVFPGWGMAYLRLENEEFVGEREVERALGRDLPDSIRNMVRGVTHKLTR